MQSAFPTGRRRHQAEEQCMSDRIVDVALRSCEEGVSQ